MTTQDHRTSARAWYADAAIWGALLLVLFTIAQFAVAVGVAVTTAGEGVSVWQALASLGWAQWAASIAGALAGLGVAWARLSAGSNPNTPDPKIVRGRPGGGVAGPPLVALVAGAALLAMTACGPAAFERGGVSYQASSFGVVALGPACSEAYVYCSNHAARVSDIFYREAAVASCDYAYTLCDIGKRKAADALERRAVEAADEDAR